MSKDIVNLKAFEGAGELPFGYYVGAKGNLYDRNKGKTRLIYHQETGWGEDVDASDRDFVLYMQGYFLGCKKKRVASRDAEKWEYLDRVAIASLQSLIAYYGNPPTDSRYEAMVADAYDYADAMWAEREKRRFGDA